MENDSSIKDEYREFFPHTSAASMFAHLLTSHGPWQCCPICNGKGQIREPNNDPMVLFGGTWKQCPLCLGEMFISSFNGLPPSKAGHHGSVIEEEPMYFIQHIMGEETISGTHFLTQSELEDDKELWPSLKDYIKRMGRRSWKTIADLRRPREDGWQYNIVKL